MRKSAMAFLLGVVVMLAAVVSTQPAPAADGPASVLYYDMGTVHVQFEAESCGLQTLVVKYQIEHTSDQQVSIITAYRPKVESILFTALREHLMEQKKVRVRAVQRVMKRAILDALGEEVVHDVLITDVQQLET